eukprot:TRINITY_DN14096_c0_g1_i1.p1 TRINITY_DN14096_c0_g1~~TRINITY_DN14096_c0_g1_i1.p1  ORF type:complete len:663 (-),score=146.87 TRINITY_DN14096_c0_g1_i1:24-2012(-)
MASMKVVPLGAGQDVGRSCVLVTLGGRNIMFDCGAHMGFSDARKFPDFTFISSTGEYDKAIDLVAISHFHLDHCGALPHFTEICGYNGPVIMSHPTKAICPILMDDYRRITADRKGETSVYTSDHVAACMRKVTAVNVGQTLVIEDMEITAYYAGHVLGAVMFLVKVGEHSVFYTGDYNMTPDRHLGAARPPHCKPDLLITETTYATTVRDSKRCRERDFLKLIHECVEKGGKVLIPVFALGRAQELCILLDTYWTRMHLGHIPIYFSAGMTQRANYYYKLFINWTNQKIKQTFVKRNMFDFTHIKAWDRAYLEHKQAQVLFATPGMLHAGTSMEVFKAWCGSEKNMVVMPGYCVAGTIGAKVLAGDKKIDLDRRGGPPVDVRLKVKHLSFSAHADAKGILQMIRQTDPRNVMLVHGEKNKMHYLKKKINREFGLKCIDPPNGVTLSVDLPKVVPVQVSAALLRRRPRADTVLDDEERRRKRIAPLQEIPLDGIAIADETSGLRLLDVQQAQEELGLVAHSLSFAQTIPLPNVAAVANAVPAMPTAIPSAIPPEHAAKRVKVEAGPAEVPLKGKAIPDTEQGKVLAQIVEGLMRWLEPGSVIVDGACVSVGAVTLMLGEADGLQVVWSFEDEELAARVLSIVNTVLSKIMPGAEIETENMET